MQGHHAFQYILLCYTSPSFCCSAVYVTVLHCVFRAQTKWSQQQQDVFAFLCIPELNERAPAGKQTIQTRMLLLLPGLPERSVTAAHEW